MGSEYKIKVFYRPDGSKPSEWIDRWMACLDNEQYGDEACHGHGSTIADALAETGRKIQVIADAERDKVRAENPCPLCTNNPELEGHPEPDCKACEGTGICAGERKARYLAQIKLEAP